MATYLVKQSGVPITSIYYGPHESPKVGDTLNLTMPQPPSDPLSNAPEPRPVHKTFKIIRIGTSPSGLVDDEYNTEEPTIFVEAV